MSGGISCIGRMGGRLGDWYAQLDFEAGEATVLERTKNGDRGPVCTVPLGAVYDADADHDCELDPSDAQNKALLTVVFAPEAWRVLNMVRERLAARRPLEDRGEIKTYQHEYEDEQLLREVADVLECLNVPWTCRGCGGTEYRMDGEQVLCDYCARPADQQQGV